MNLMNTNGPRNCHICLQPIATPTWPGQDCHGVCLLHDHIGLLETWPAALLQSARCDTPLCTLLDLVTFILFTAASTQSALDYARGTKRPRDSEDN